MGKLTQRSVRASGRDRNQLAYKSVARRLRAVPCRRSRLQAKQAQFWRKLVYRGEVLKQNDRTNQQRIYLAIDWDHLHQISDSNAAFEQELLHIFVVDAQSHLDSAQNALTTGDHQEIVRVAHYIKGASSNVGLKEMQTIASELEHQAQQQQLQHAPGLLLALKSSIQGVKDFLYEGETKSI